ncbi:hypothetical protein ERO13_A09G052156v2 [Gossypium hirsutum]|uniref:Uncharacterized protein n=2 Tax=Gossypium TaxID=3633 RepID=A0A5J5UBW3_GOSBA|nr:hypothetical protein ES319_A09G055400v1 [Gossypium barbadense]KAG4182567.1 hypothetical protein ERO13_A09G052156v2 [Gossypium hirsutum]TYJ17523.1 hypothetical protein E1A91_A09G057900v1 [Gossypium mustelinum]
MLPEPGEISAPKPFSTSISTKKGEEIHGLFTRYGFCAGVWRRRRGCWRVRRLGLLVVRCEGWGARGELSGA